MMIRICLLLAFSISSAHAGITLINADSANEGLNDSTPATPVGGNPGTTLGQQRLNVFNKVTDILNDVFSINQPLAIQVKFDPLPCSATSGVLGQAGPNNYQFVNTNGVYTTYPDALANQLQNQDAEPGKHEINATFNSDLDKNSCLGTHSWYYGFDSNVGSNNSLLSVVLHEITHGMGFLSLLQSDGSSGASIGGNPVYDIYTKHLTRQSTGTRLSDMASNTDRSAAMRANGDLVWNGSALTAQANSLNSGRHASGKVLMYAPSTYEPGSSVGHFDKSLTPNDIMEPVYTEFLKELGLSAYLLQDLGWTLKNNVNSNSAPVFEQVASQTLLAGQSKSITLTATDSDNDLLTYAFGTVPDGIQASLNNNQLNITADNSFSGLVTLNVSVNDGHSSDSQNINIRVLPVFEMQSGNNIIRDGETITATGNNALPLAFSGGDNQLSIDVFYDKNTRNDLLNQLEGQYYLQSPATGAFAGIYRLNVSDQSGFSATYYVERPLRVAVSISPFSLIDASKEQFIYVEGAPAGTDITLGNDNDDVTFLNEQQQETTRATATDDATIFNRARAQLAIKAPVQKTRVNFTATAPNLPDGTLQQDILASKTVQLTVRNNSNTPLHNANITVNNALSFPLWQLPGTAVTDEQGQASLIMPKQDQVLRASAIGHSDSELTLSADQLSAQITLDKALIPIQVSGTITAQGFSFNQELPRVVLKLKDSRRITLSVNPVSADHTRAQYQWLGDGNNPDPEFLEVSHSQALFQRVAVPASEKASTLTIILEADTQKQLEENGAQDNQNNSDKDSQPDKKSGFSLGNAFYLLLLSVFFILIRALAALLSKFRRTIGTK